MKKFTLLVLLSVFVFSCSSDDESCADKRAEINAHYDAQIAWVEENTDPIDFRQIELMNQERENKLDEACN